MLFLKYDITFNSLIGLGMLYQPSDYLKVYARIEALHAGNVIECVMRSLTFDAHSFLNGVAHLEHQLDPIYLEWIHV